jgi:hypothetical protein
MYVMYWFQSLLSHGSARAATARVFLARHDGRRDGVGLYMMHPVHPYIESAWFQPLNLKMQYPGFEVCFFKFNLHRATPRWGSAG